MGAFGPEEYSRWRQSPLGGLTERVETDALLELCGDLRGGRVLDIGCGDGTFALAAARRGARVSAADVSAGMLESARLRASGEGLEVDWRQAPAEALPFDDGAFDLAVAGTLLCLHSDPPTVVREARRVLRRGGVLIVGELGRWNAWAAARRLRGLFGSGRWSGVRFWTMGGLRRLLRDAGFSVSETRGCVYYPPWSPAARLLGPRDRLFRPLGQFGAAYLIIAGRA